MPPGEDLSLENLPDEFKHFETPLYHMHYAIYYLFLVSRIAKGSKCPTFYVQWKVGIRSTSSTMMSIL